MAYSTSESPRNLIWENHQQNLTMSTSWECIAFDGERVPHGENFVPGPDNCTACKCEKGEARFCRAALCQPPQDCKSFRVGDSCCDFICLDDILPPLNKDAKDIGPSSDAGLRMVASAITAILSLALLLFLIHRLRQRKLRTAQHQYFEDQLDALGGFPPDSCRSNPCCHSSIYLSGNDHVDFFLDGHTPPFSPWKPPSYYFQPGDAPPPYSEVVANDRARAEGPLPSLNPLMVQLSPPNESSVQEGGGAPQRLKVSQQDSVSVAESHSQARAEIRVPREDVAQSLAVDPVLSASLLSDQTYEASGGIIARARPHSMHNPLAGPLNDLNKGTNETFPSSSVSRPMKTNSASSLRKGSNCPCDCTYKMEKCNICLVSTQQVSSQYGQLAIRPRPKYSHFNPATDAVIEEFQHRLRQDASASSTSIEETSLSISLKSSSSRSTDETTSIGSRTEAKC